MYLKSKGKMLRNFVGVSGIGVEVMVKYQELKQKRIV